LRWASAVSPAGIYRQGIVALLPSSGQVWYVRKTAADELVAGLEDELHHFRMPRLVVCTLYEDESWLAIGGCLVKFEFGRGNAVNAFESVFITEKTHIDITPAGFMQINRIGPSVLCGQVFEQKDLKEPPEQRIVLNELFDGPPLRLEFLLDAAETGFYG
jgi:hypothetical protein